MAISIKKTFLFVILSFCCIYLTGQNVAQVNKRKLDSLNQKLSTLKADTSLAKVYIELAWEIKYTEVKKAEEYCIKAIALLKNNHQPALIANAYKILGIISDEYGKYDQSINYYIKAIDFYKKVSDTIGVARTECNIGMLYRKISQPKESIPYFTKCIPIFEKSNFLMGVNLAHQNLGIAYYDLQQFDKALVHFQSALKVLEANHVEDPALYGNLANCYSNLKDPKKNEYYLLKCIKAFEAEGDSSSNYYFWIHNLGIHYCRQGNINKGLPLIEKGVKGYKKHGLLNSYLGIHMLESLAIYYYKANKPKEAYLNLRKAMSLNDSIYKNDIASQMTEQKEKYEADKKELSISNLEKEKKLKDVEIEQQSTQKYIMGIGLLFAIGMLFMMYRNFQQKKKDNEIIKKQKDIVDQKNKEVKDSIMYAKRLQDAILPPIGLMKTFFPESFLLYKPKDIVAGDFFWMESINPSIQSKSDETKLLIAAADCTGHGVPGAMVSVICSTALNRCVKEFHLSEPADILNKTRELVIETFENSGTNVKDGMDISLASIIRSGSENTTTVKWSGANNALWYTHKGVLKNIAGNKQPIGKIDDPKPFSNHQIELQAGDHIFLFTDGFADQFGGEKGKKFKYRQLQDLLNHNLKLSMEDQKQKLEKAFMEWMGDLEQVDDVCVIGVRV